MQQLSIGIVFNLLDILKGKEEPTVANESCHVMPLSNHSRWLFSNHAHRLMIICISFQNFVMSYGNVNGINCLRMQMEGEKNGETRIQTVSTWVDYLWPPRFSTVSKKVSGIRFARIIQLHICELRKLIFLFYRLSNFLKVC